MSFFEPRKSISELTGIGFDALQEIVVGPIEKLRTQVDKMQAIRPSTVTGLAVETLKNLKEEVSYIASGQNLFKTPVLPELAQEDVRTIENRGMKSS